MYSNSTDTYFQNTTGQRANTLMLATNTFRFCFIVLRRLQIVLRLWRIWVNLWTEFWKRKIPKTISLKRLKLQREVAHVRRWRQELVQIRQHIQGGPQFGPCLRLQNDWNRRKTQLDEFRKRNRPWQIRSVLRCRLRQLSLHRKALAVGTRQI